ncbi:MAG TPA: VOC family protein [Thermoanaerobaculia bacterium]|nr:VOC family protein [Thermoanaerobaculia bacterium]
MEKITPHLWFDKEAKEAASLYTSAFPGSSIKSTVVLHNTPSGSVDIVTIDLAGQEFTLLNAGPLFQFTPAISFLVGCETKDEVDRLWAALADGGSALMELGRYPFSERYGWLQDRYGVSWQIMFAGGSPVHQKITPTLMYTGEQAGKTEEAMKYYTSVFRQSSIADVLRYGPDEAPDREGTVKHAAFVLEGQQFAAMDSALLHGFGFNEAISLQVHCGSQKEVDYYWDRLSADPKAEACGWLKDRFGVSWQIVPASMDRMLESGTPEQIGRVTEAFLQMKKFDLARLDAAYRGVD